jgi:tetratricopeptide (TPR) repeat protein
VTEQHPDFIGKYEVIRRIGRGGMGTVYLGRHPEMDRFVAIKVLRDPLFDEELLQRFFREARSAGNLRHENIVTVYDVDQYDRQPFMAMEYVDGTPLSEVIRHRQPLTLGDKLSYIEQICSGLYYAHSKGIIHRDIKPANLMVDRNGVIRILDFGIARVEGSGMTSDGSMIGTLNYMSPEQMLGRPVDYRSDIFAVGAVSYELLAYQQAFSGTLETGLLQKLPYEDPPSLMELSPGLPPEVEQVVLRALAKRPEDRFPDLGVARTAIREIRRSLDPAIEATIIATRRKSPRVDAVATPASSAERRELLERRARQIAVHREAARIALNRQDLDRAIAACEDALTLDPDDAEALRLLSQIQQAQQHRDQESKERHELERTVRQRIADVDLRLNKGDVAGAVAAAEQALALDPHNSGVVALLPRVRQAAAAAGVPLRFDPIPKELERDSRRYRPIWANIGLFTGLVTLVAAVAFAVVWWISDTDISRVPDQAVVSPTPEIVPALPPAPSPTPAPQPPTPVLAPPSPISTPANPSPAPRPAPTPTPAPAAIPAPIPTPKPAPIPAPVPAPPVLTPVPTPLPAIPIPVPAPPVPTPVPTPVPAPSVPVPTPPSPAPSPSTPTPLAREGPGIMKALNRYQDAYRDRSVKALQAVYPSLPRETGQKLDRTFRDCRAYEVTFLSPQIFLNPEDPGHATVQVQTTYACQPRTAQPVQPATVQEVFQLRKIEDGLWVINSAGIMDSGLRR